MYSAACHSDSNTWLLVVVLILQVLFVILFIMFVVLPMVRVERTINQVQGQVASTLDEVKSAICGFLPTLPICKK